MTNCTRCNRTIKRTIYGVRPTTKGEQQPCPIQFPSDCTLPDPADR